MCETQCAAVILHFKHVAVIFFKTIGSNSINQNAFWLLGRYLIILNNHQSMYETTLFPGYILLSQQHVASTGFCFA